MRFSRPFVAAIFLPTLAIATPQCGISADARLSEPDITSDTRPLSGGTELQQPPVASNARSSRQSVTLSLNDTPSPVAADALLHVKQAGAQITELGPLHGFRTAIARNGQQFMAIYLVPDGSAYVNGLMSELSPGEIEAMAPGQVTELRPAHGLRGLFVRNGGQFQVFYASPDGQRVVPGSLIDAEGRNVTKQQIAAIPGAVPTVVIGDGAVKSAFMPSGPASLLSVAEGTNFGTLGDANAPRLWMFIDPLCSWSVKAMEQLRPFVASGRLQLAVIPTAVLDDGDHGQSKVAAKAMLSLPADAMVPAWNDRNLDGNPRADASQLLTANMAAAEAIKLRGTPTFLWRKTDGTIGRADGLPQDVAGMIASVGK